MGAECSGEREAEEQRERGELQFALHDLDLSVTNARTVAVTILVACGLYLVMALEAVGSRRRSTLVAAMCAALAGIYVAALAIAATRRFFELTLPDVVMIATAVCASAVSIAGLALCGFSLTIALIQRAPRVGQLRVSGGLQQVPVEKVQVGDVVVVRNRHGCGR